ncbi:MarR family winged helix-turn-helix transcriptional regulator [Spongiibacter tropicus]|uniref:MarR family winged helix-turn-helix transcriptional regulator n=1 Tax=Spongiibacter tropicus TaxID=454602 RepID=UPI0003B42244|nr:MarR family transcriptional regulator [Spongiibacter tropicus]
MRNSNLPSQTNIPAAGEGKRGESGYLGYLLRQAAGAYHTRLARALSDLAITPPQFSVMTMINAYPGASNADIARLAILTPQTVSVIIGNLEKAGLVIRRPHAIHGRIQQLELSEQGKQQLSTARRRAHTIEKELTEELAKNDEDVIRRWLAGAAQRMNEK